MAIVLADSRFPGGGHAHSGGLEEAAARGLVRTEADLPGFLVGRLRTAGELAAVFAAAAAHAARRRVSARFWARLDEELDARTPSAAQREASRAQGSGTLRALKATFSTSADLMATISTPSELMATFSTSELLKVAMTTRPHHAIVLGAAIGLGGGLPVDAALAAAYLSVSGPASAAVRLLGLDPLRVNAMVTGLAPAMRDVAARAAGTAGREPADLPAPGAPGLDLLAEAHARHHKEEVRLFAS